MLENSTFPENSAGASTAADNDGNEQSLAGGSFSTVIGEEELARESEDGGDRNSSGNRWPREETLALLKIRAKMDAAFRDSGSKAPLWEDVSRKLAELGYQRSAKKCKEKFENIYKYHRRTKQGRSSRPNSKTYRFFEQLEALDNNPPSLLPPPEKIDQNPLMAATAVTVAAAAAAIKPINSSKIVMEISTSTTSSSEKIKSEGTRRRKRRFSNFFDRLMKEVMEKQESLQKKFIETIERHERERLDREEAWKMRETERIKREHELLLQERSIAAAKDAAVIAFLQKFSDPSSSPVQFQPESLTPRDNKSIEKQENSNNNGENNYIQTSSSSSRWPKAEVDALIRIRTTFEQQYQDNGPKGPLWEEISAAMKKIGHDRSAKRCKEKWENINKYYKRVKDSSKKRAEDSKTCPYFHQLEALYRNKTNKKVIDSSNKSNNSGNYNFKPEDLLMQMMGGGGGGDQQQRMKGTNVDDQNNQEENDLEDDDVEEEEEGEEEEDDDDRDNYQVVANGPSSIAIME